MKPYVPRFKCEYCGEFSDSHVSGDTGIFVPCQCKKAREQRDRDHYIRNERMKQLRRQNNK